MPQDQDKYATVRWENLSEATLEFAGGEALDAEGVERAVDALKARIPTTWGRWISCGSGWHPILAVLDRRLSEVFPDYEPEQIKEKYGTLRFYWEPAAKDELESKRESAGALVRAAESAAERTCEICGQDGEMRVTKTPGRWWTTLCDQHAKARDMITPSEWETWWKEEEPRYVAELRKEWVEKNRGKSAAVIAGGPSRRVVLPARAVSDATEARDLAAEGLDLAWIADDEVGAAFVEALIAHYADHAGHLAAIRAQQRAANRGVSLGGCGPEGCPEIYALVSEAQQRFQQDLYTIGVHISWPDERYFEPEES